MSEKYHKKAEEAKIKYEEAKIVAEQRYKEVSEQAKAKYEEAQLQANSSLDDVAL